MQKTGSPTRLVHKEEPRVQVPFCTLGNLTWQVPSSLGTKDTSAGNGDIVLSLVTREKRPVLFLCFPSWGRYRLLQWCCSSSGSKINMSKINMSRLKILHVCVIKAPVGSLAVIVVGNSLNADVHFYILRSQPSPCSGRVGQAGWVPWHCQCLCEGSVCLSALL